MGDVLMEWIQLTQNSVQWQTIANSNKPFELRKSRECFDRLSNYHNFKHTMCHAIRIV
jgi:hypothetical protein